MRVLCVLAHPKPESFTGALLERFAAGLAQSGHQAEIADLYREDFDPCYSEEDFDNYRGKAPLAPDIVREQQRARGADALALFFPLWWWSFPAILKGWADRVFRGDFAVREAEGQVVGALTYRKAVILTPAAASRDDFRRYGYHAALQRQVDPGIFGYCGLADVETYIFPNVDSDPAARVEHLQKAFDIGRDFDTTSGRGNQPLQ